MVTSSIQMDSLHTFLDQVKKLDPKDDDFAVDYVNLMLEFVIPTGASDIHLNPTPDAWHVLLRIDGVLVELLTLSKGGISDPVTRLMVMAGLPSYRSGQPMEGRVKIPSDLSANLLPQHRATSLRLGVFPTVHGPRAVLRLLRQQQTLGDLSELGFDEPLIGQLAKLCLQTSGAVLLSGPAGSGKTTTLYAMLRRIAAQKPGRCVLTIEDPVESVIPNINQSEIDVAAGMTLASSLRSAVRQDSEVLLVSEIRDPETAEVAVQASLTGHLVFASLHATDIPTTLRRLINYGIPIHAIQSGLGAIVNQRLLRKKCTSCDQPAATKECESCLGTGYKGRVAIAQCVCFDGNDPIGNSFFSSIAKGASNKSIIAEARSFGWRSLRQQAISLCEQGVTDQAETFRVFGRLASSFYG